MLFLALHESFQKTDAEYAKFAQRMNLTEVMGSTGVVVVIFGTQMYIAWVGDSEACLVSNKGDVFKFVDCHKPKYEVQGESPPFFAHPFHFCFSQHSPLSFLVREAENREPRWLRVRNERNVPC